MDLIKPFEPKEVQSSVELADRLNEMARVINLILANPTGALQLLVDAEKSIRKKCFFKKQVLRQTKRNLFQGCIISDVGNSNRLRRVMTLQSQKH